MIKEGAEELLKMGRAGEEMVGLCDHAELLWVGSSIEEPDSLGDGNVGVALPVYHKERNRGAGNRSLNVQRPSIVDVTPIQPHRHLFPAIGIGCSSPCKVPVDSLRC